MGKNVKGLVDVRILFSGAGVTNLPTHAHTVTLTLTHTHTFIQVAARRQRLRPCPPQPAGAKAQRPVDHLSCPGSLRSGAAESRPPALQDEEAPGSSPPQGRARGRGPGGAPGGGLERPAPIEAPGEGLRAHPDQPRALGKARLSWITGRVRVTVCAPTSAPAIWGSGCSMKGALAHWARAINRCLQSWDARGRGGRGQAPTSP